MGRKIVILGNGSFAREVADLIGLPIFGYYADVGESTINEIPKDAEVICGIVSTERKNLIEQVNNNFFSIIRGDHSLEVEFGKGVFCGRSTTISRGSKIGNHVIINRGATIGHDVTIGNYSTIGPGVNIAGNVTIREQVFIGMGANIREGVFIGSNAIIGAMSLVLKDVKMGSKVWGIPAKEREVS